MVSSPETPIRVLLADDQALVRGALAALLNLEPDIRVVAQAGSGAEVLALAMEHQVDVALLDVQMPEMDGLQAAAQLREGLPGCKVLMVTTFDRPGYLRAALDAGACGFLVKDAPSEELAAAVRSVHSGGRVVDPQLAARSRGQGANPLTERERQVLSRARAGTPVAQIAAGLFLSVGTVRNHLSSAIGKTGAANRIEAAHVAHAQGWI
ncbi:two-component system response regulator DesR [Arthrobacter stackebrandtii]|uniref:Two-component system response regulator DesR n=1 Tax=Arthrobacter stackebrandtii TaxID=272161 RepID=A0ABS4YXK5_9MICC|nr:response regulator transcription factor [Arthrobacter stackebrandtii]MBP2413527.1 two-component system response regulator DesR [Arthrobacter stackebrandtii]PYH00637.1 DNA-binding response regulator [Arthrobacter stackebrandtii]